MCAAAGVFASNPVYQRSVKSGEYIPWLELNSLELGNLPVPESSENYAFLHSHEKTSTIVLGEFLGSEPKITFIRDKNGDGKVDEVVYWNVRQRKRTIVREPESVCTAEQFKTYKQDIINGVRNQVAPNPDGAQYLKRLIERNEVITKIYKLHYGYRIEITDPDDPSLVRATFIFADNGIHGRRLVYQVNYHNRNAVKVRPVITYSVYCKDSFDEQVAEVVKELIALTKKAQAED